MREIRKYIDIERDWLQGRARGEFFVIVTPNPSSASEQRITL